jgi:CDP-4-dehydro-6-deoxyglucose reductase, E1
MEDVDVTSAQGPILVPSHEMETGMSRTIAYADCVFGDEEIQAVLEVLRRGPGGLRASSSVMRFEAEVSQRFGRNYGVMCNSGSSAINLALDLLDIEEGSEVITPALTFSTDVTAIIRAGLVPAFVDVEPNTYTVSLSRVTEMIGPKTRAIFIPNLIGNIPDWDELRRISDRHSLLLIEDSCDAFAPALRGTPTSDRADITVTSFALAHAITCAGHGGMVLIDDVDVWRRGLMTRRWGRTSELLLFDGSGRDRSYRQDLDGIPYNSDMIYEVLSWNMEPTEIAAAFGLVQLTRLKEFETIRRENFKHYNERFKRLAAHFISPIAGEGADPSWMAYPAEIAETAGFGRPELLEFLDARGIGGRTVWSGNITRHPMMRTRQYRVSDSGLPNCDRVMKSHLILPCHQGMTAADVDYVCDEIEHFLEGM